MPSTRAAMRSMDAALAVDDDEPTCAICLQPLSDAARVRLPCEHDQFCGQCLCDHLLRDARCPICRAGNDNDDAQSYISEEFSWETVRERKERKKKAMEDARRVAKTDKRVQKSFDKIREWNLKAAALKAFVKEKRGVLDAAERVMKSKITLYEEKLDVEFRAEYGEIEKTVKKARADYIKAKGRSKQIKTVLIRRYIRDT